MEFGMIDYSQAQPAPQREVIETPVTDEERQGIEAEHFQVNIPLSPDDLAAERMARFMQRWTVFRVPAAERDFTIDKNGAVIPGWLTRRWAALATSQAVEELPHSGGGVEAKAS